MKILRAGVLGAILFVLGLVMEATAGLACYMTKLELY